MNGSKLNSMMNNKTMNLFTFILLLFVMMHFASAEDSVNMNDWQFTGDVYLWGAEIKADTPGSDIDISFNDIIDNLDMAVMGTLKAQKDKLKLYTDIIYLDIEDSDKGQFQIPIGRTHLLTGGDKLDVEIKSWIVQPMVGYTVYKTPEYSIDLGAGARYLWLEVDMELTTTSPLGASKTKTSESGHNWDGIVSVRGDFKLSDKWDAAIYFDGGSGDSDYTWQGLAGVSYEFDNFKGFLGYRHLKWDFDDDSLLENMQVSGPFVGARFNF